MWHHSLSLANFFSHVVPFYIDVKHYAKQPITLLVWHNACLLFITHCRGYCHVSQGVSGRTLFPLSHLSQGQMGTWPHWLSHQITWIFGNYLMAKTVACQATAPIIEDLEIKNKNEKLRLISKAGVLYFSQWSKWALQLECHIPRIVAGTCSRVSQDLPVGTVSWAYSMQFYPCSD